MVKQTAMKKKVVQEEDYDSEESVEEIQERPTKKHVDSDDDNDEPTENATIEDDDHEDDDDETVIPLSKKKPRNKKARAARKPQEVNESPVIYIGRIPHGFYESQMKGFFSQFGTIKNIRISRNKNSGKCKGFGFIEFDSPEVAQIVTDTMHNYILFGHRLQCRIVPLEKIHPEIWKGANRKFRARPWKKEAREQRNKVREPQQTEKIVKRLLKKEEKKRAKVAALGIDYEFPGYASCVPAQPIHKKFN